MQDVLIDRFIAFMAMFSLNYDFLHTGYEADMWFEGFGMTLYLVALTLPISIALGFVFAAALTSGKPFLAGPVKAYVELTRNTPTLVQLMCGFFVLNMLVSNMVGGAKYNPLSPIFWVVAVTSLHTAALNAEALRAGVEAVPTAMIEAARGIGFSRLKILRYVEFPLAVRIALPAMMNNLINLVKLSTIASAIAVGDITYASIMIWTQHDNVIELMLVILVFFSAINFIVAKAGHWLEKRLSIPGFGQ